MKSLLRSVHVALWKVKRALQTSNARARSRLRSARLPLLRAAALRIAVAALRWRGQGRVPSPRLLRWLEYGWANGGWPATPEYLLETARLAVATKGPIVEAGSGISSIVLSYVVAAEQPVVSFEHHEHWAERVARHASRRGSYRILTRPLTPRGEYDWYAVEPSDLPSDITLAIVDGPPGSTRGGRYGAMPELAEHLAAGAILLLDDASRPEETRAIARWADECGTDVEMRDVGTRAFALVRLPRA